MISHPRSLCRIFCPAEAQASADFFIVERAQILQNSTENCKICAFSILSESTSQKASISHKQKNTRSSKYRQNLCWAVILPPARAPPFLTFAYSRKWNSEMEAAICWLKLFKTESNLNGSSSRKRRTANWLKQSRKRRSYILRPAKKSQVEISR